MASTLTNPNPPLKHLDRLAQDYEVPKAVKVALDADIKQAHAAAITSALFAIALLTLAQMISDADTTTDTTTTTWLVLHFFTYSAIILNLVVCFTCLITIKMCTDIPHRAQQAVAEGMDTPALRAARGGVIPRGITTSHYALLELFGMSRGYRLISGVMLPIMITLAFTYTFVALTIWVWATQSRLNAGITMLTVVPTSLCVVFVIRTTVASQGWH